MIELPAATPVTTPVVGSTVAMDVLLLVQDPPLPPVFVKVVVEPTHRLGAPLTDPAFGEGFTVMVMELLLEPHPLETL